MSIGLAVAGGFVIGPWILVESNSFGTVETALGVVAACVWLALVITGIDRRIAIYEREQNRIASYRAGIRYDRQWLLARFYSIAKSPANGGQTSDATSTDSNILRTPDDRPH